MDNKAVRRQIYQLELEGLYIDSVNMDHHKADVLTGMRSCSSTHKKISSNLIDFFNTYNTDTQTTFQEVFGPSSLLYDYSPKRYKRYAKNYAATPYQYRKKEPYIADISYEFLQFLRVSQLSDKWSIEILRLMDGLQHHAGYNSLRLYNFTRLIAQINLFISTGNIYKYKFLQHLKPYYYKAVNIEGAEIDLEYIKEIEEYIFRQLLHFMFSENESKDQLFYQFAEQWIIELIIADHYKGLLLKHAFISIMLDEVQVLNTAEYKKAFTEALSAYYHVVNQQDVPDELQLEAIQKQIAANPKSEASYEKIAQNDLFGEISLKGGTKNHSN